MIKVFFEPSGKEINIETGTLISDATSKCGIKKLHLPCGGKGTCEHCLVEVISGDYKEKKSPAVLDDSLKGKNIVMACQTMLFSDSIVKIHETDLSIKTTESSHTLIDQEFLPKTISNNIFTIKIKIPEATIDTNYADSKRLEIELKKIYTNYSFSINLFVLSKMAYALRENNGEVFVILKKENNKIIVIDISHTEITPYTIAVDIGTTTIALNLINLINGKIESSFSSYNNQIQRGSDVISRIDYVKNIDSRRFEMKELVLETINNLLEKACNIKNINPEHIYSAIFAGNTTMYHMFLALPPAFIREYPYCPTANSIDNIEAREAGILINPNGKISFISGIGSYVGGDITSGLLCSEIAYKNEEVYLFIDIGTNGEMVVGNSDWMIGCACSAGPAFEGSGIKCGMRATEGAIEYIEISDNREEVTYSAIGNGKPSGICGSGLICLLGQLLLKGIIDQMGKINSHLEDKRIVKIENTYGYIIEFAENTASGKDIAILETDIDNLMRTKAAIYSAANLTLTNVGIDWNSISKVYIAGGFGRFIQIEDAILIGLLPDLDRNKFEYIGNSSLTGAYMCAISKEKMELTEKIANAITYMDLSSEPKYMDAYMAALFLPHTDINLFPSVKNALGK